VRVANPEILHVIQHQLWQARRMLRFRIAELIATERCPESTAGRASSVIKLTCARIEIFSRFSPQIRLLWKWLCP
jgi:hypothetical protein